MLTISRKHLLAVIGVALIASVGGFAAWSMTWTSSKITMTAHSVSTVGIGLFEDCACSIPLAAYDWGPVTGGQYYLCNIYLKNMGPKGVYITYAPSYLSFYDGQVRFYIDVYILATGLQCQTYPVNPPVGLPEKDPTVCNIGYFLGPGKMAKLLVVFWVESIVYGATYSWELSVYGCAP